MSKFEFGQIVLLEFPFTDGGTHKNRPAIVLADTLDGDLILPRITSQTYSSKYDIIVSDWQQAGLKLESIIRLYKIATLESSLVIKKMGVLSSADMKKTKELINSILDNA